MKKLLVDLNLKRRLISFLAASHFYGNPSARLKIIGVTGTNGKTTTTTLLYKIAKELGYKAGLVGTVENIIDGESMPTGFTTPEPRELYALLNKMADRGCEYVFMEVSSHGLDQDRVAGLCFTAGIFTNLTHDHLDYHKTMENYFQAKKKLFRMLPKDAFALGNSDDPNGVRMLDGITARRYFYGFSSKPDKAELEYFQGKVKKLNFEGLELDINGSKIHSRLLGKFNSYNLLSVWSASKLLGFPMEKVGKILENIEPPRGRFEHFTTPGGVLVVVDYAHTPDALENILRAVKEVKSSEGKIISIFGCGGDRDPSKRKVMGKLGAELSDTAIFTSDNPRSEDPEKIIRQMKESLNETDNKKVISIADRREAIEKGLSMGQKGDVVLIAGKGHESYQEVKGVKRHFDDLEEARTFSFLRA